MTAPGETGQPARERGRVSVCMATWNGAEFVREQLASILPELGPDDEVVVVDDASQDGTVAVIQGLADPRIKLFPQPVNRGYVRAFEKALSLASGDYIFLSDQDDIWKPGRVRLMLDAMGDDLMVVSNCEHIEGSPGFFQRIRLHERDSRAHARNIVGILVGYRLHWGCAMAFRRELLGVALPFPRFMDESHDQYLAMAANVLGSIRYVETDTIWHRLHAQNLTPRGLRSVKQILKARAEFIAELGVLGSRAHRNRTSNAPARHPGRSADLESADEKSVAVVVSCYNPPNDLVQRAAGWVKTVGPVVAVDDGSPNADPEVWEGLEAAGVDVIHLGENSGIAHTLNTGIRRAIHAYAPAWILTMDQDSDFTPAYVKYAFEAYREALNPDNVGMLCAESLGGARSPVTVTPEGATEPLDPIQSGTFIRVSMMNEIGLLHEPLFIDLVDSEFNARARQHGWVLLMAPGCDLVHSQGITVPATLFGHRLRVGSLQPRVNYHPPVRLYYMARNYCYIAARCARSQPTWLARKLLIDLRTGLVRLLFGPHRRQQMLAIMYGLHDGTRRHMGRIDPYLAEKIVAPESRDLRPSTSVMSHDSDGNPLVVEILLSTWNGEDHLSELLDSLLAQNAPVQVRILVRDDGSTDSTRDILQSYASRHDSIRVIVGSNVGVIRSFQILMNEMSPDAQLAMFCDQDDVWLPDKITAALADMASEATAPEPVLYCSRSMLTDANLTPLNPTVDHPQGPSFRHAMIQNIAPGHTMMANRALVVAARKSYDPDAIFMHDHWWYLVAAGLGRVHFDRSWHTFYRMHDHNVIGYNVGFLQRTWSKVDAFFSFDFTRYARQCRAFQEQFADQLEPRERARLAGFVDQGGFGSRLLYVIRFGFRQSSIVTAVVVGLLFLMGRYEYVPDRSERK